MIVVPLDLSTFGHGYTHHRWWPHRKLTVRYPEHCLRLAISLFTRWCLPNRLFQTMDDTSSGVLPRAPVNTFFHSPVNFICYDSTPACVFPLTVPRINQRLVGSSG